MDVDDHRHSGEFSVSPLTPFGIRSSGSGSVMIFEHTDAGRLRVAAKRGTMARQ
jgi:hypothetical protein